MEIRPAAAADRDRILEILIATGRFNQEEVDCAIELVDSALANPDKGEYIVELAEQRASSGARVVERIDGYVCYGPTPLTDGVFDLYWIAVDPSTQGKGIGQKLLEHVEEQVRKTKGRMLLIETSSKDTYGSAVRFYERGGYHEISRIKDFYRIEDDKIVFCKKLS